jgi:hypothetical protein
MKKDIEEIKVDISEIKLDLREHMRRTDILEDLHQDNQKRIALLEEPKKAREYITSIVVDVSKFLGFILAMAAVISLFYKP